MPWLMVALCALLQALNYADKAILGVAAVPIMADLGLSPSQFGYVGSSFFLLFAIGGIAAGLVADRLPAKPVMTAMILVWAVTQFPMIGGVTLTILLANRIVLGAAEGPATPIMHHFLFKWFPEHARALPSALIRAGLTTGVVLSAPILTWVIHRYDWHVAFGALGAIGLVAVPFWAMLAREGPVVDRLATADAAPRRAPSYCRLLTTRTALGNLALSFVFYWNLTLAIAWLPAFLIKGAGYSPANAAWLVSLAWIVSGVCCPLTGFVSGALSRCGVPGRWARGALGGASLIAAGFCLMAMAIQPPGPAQTALLVAGFVLSQNMSPLVFTILGEVMPTERRATVFAIFSALMTTAGLVSPVVMGYAIEHGSTVLAGYQYGYVLAGLITVAGGIVGIILIDPAADRARLAA